MSKNLFIKMTQGALSGLGTALLLSYAFDITLEEFPSLFSLETKKWLKTAALWGSLFTGVCFPLDFSSLKKKKPSTRLFFFEPSLLKSGAFLNLIESGLLERSLVIPSSVFTLLKSEGKGEEAEKISTLCKKYEIKTVKANLEDSLGSLSCKYLYPLIVENKLFFDEDPPFSLIDFASLFPVASLKEIGELLNVRVFRKGKEPLQGIGYLEDSSMVVINGGAPFLGNEIPVQVLSIKNTASGRIIFSNILNPTK